MIKKKTPLKTSYIVHFHLTIDYEYAHFEYDFGTNKDLWKSCMEMFETTVLVLLNKNLLYFRNLLPNVMEKLQELFYDRADILDNYGYYDGIISIVFEERTTRKFVVL